jgi:HAD superfamily hydrolase (TIGR01509 family)
VPPRAVLWDMDGTLVDSRAFHWRSWQEALAADGVAVTEAQFLATFGRRNDAILSGWLGVAATPERIRRIGDAKETSYRRLVAENGLSPLTGVADWVRRLDAAGWRQAVASSAPHLNVEVVLRVIGLERYFGALVAAEDVRRGKPDPEVFLTAAARLGVPPDRCVVVEDVEHGIEAAHRAGMRAIGVGGLTAGDLVVGSLAELPPDAFEQLLRIKRG